MPTKVMVPFAIDSFVSAIVQRRQKRGRLCRKWMTSLQRHTITLSQSLLLQKCCRGKRIANPRACVVHGCRSISYGAHTPSCILHAKPLRTSSVRLESHCAHGVLPSACRMRPQIARTTAIAMCPTTGSRAVSGATNNSMIPCMQWTTFHGPRSRLTALPQRTCCSFSVSLAPERGQTVSYSCAGRSSNRGEATARSNPSDAPRSPYTLSTYKTVENRFDHKHTHTRTRTHSTASLHDKQRTRQQA